MLSNIVNNFSLNIILIIISLIKSIISDCGLPAIPPNAKINSFEFIYSENTQIEYYCELPELVLLNGKTRVCKNGGWVGPIPICMEEISSNPIESILITDGTGRQQNNTNPIKSEGGKALIAQYEKGECIGSGTRSVSSKPITFTLNLHRKYEHISYFEVVLRTGNAFNSSDILLESIMTERRMCSASVMEAAVAPSYLLRLKLMCDLVTNTDDETEDIYYSEDSIQNITLKLDTNSISICEVRLFYRKYDEPHRCGSPDAPLHSSVDMVAFGSKYGSVPNYRYTCDKNFELVGNQDVRCGVNNYWLDDFPACVPKIKCPVPPEPAQIDDLVTIRWFYDNLYQFNGMDTAIPGSHIIYNCDESRNGSKVMLGDSVRVCTESGKWSGIQPYCLDLSELKLDKYSEVFEQKIINETTVEIRYQNETTDCGLPAMPKFAKPAPSRYMYEDIRSQYPNGTKIQMRCEQSFHVMFSETKARICKDRKWTGSVGRCEVSLTSITVSNFSTIISEWYRPERNDTNKTEENVYYYDENAFNNWDGGECAPFNISDRQEIRLKLNDSQHISSFMVYLKPGGIYGGLISVPGATKNVTTKPLIAEVDRSICTVDLVYDYPPHSSHILFMCDNDRGRNDYSSATVDEIVVYVHPDQFDKKYDPKNVSLCSLTLFHSSDTCGLPDRPLNSIVTIDNQIAYYSCEEGYELIGASSVLCLSSGKWAEEFPICRLKADLCPKLSQSFGVLSQYSHTGNDTRILMGTLINVRCAPTLPNFVGKPILVGSRSRICQGNGEWSGSKPFCIDSSKFVEDEVEPYTLSTKALTIIIGTSVSMIIVIILIALIICCHLYEKCYQCCSHCFRRHTIEDNSDFNHNKCLRPESKVDINEINETLNRLATFRPYDHQVSVHAQPDNNSPDIIEPVPIH